MLFINKNSKTFNKKIKLQLQLGFSKLTPKLNLTLAPLGINLINLVNDFNKFNYFFFDINNILNCILYINTTSNYYNLNIINNNKNFLKKLFLEIKEKKIILLTFIYIFEKFLKTKLTKENVLLKNFIASKKYFINNKVKLTKMYKFNNYFILKLDKNLFLKILKQNK
ncbi:hypothetical protein GW796_11245 [archaeon]|nr:hypothetical protein [archaeon]